ncbi:MAG TPA: sugar phosphate isomerase/epimerase [Candidatus Aerophobetes bacterium]|uniref:Sugar phosphate isomerase/epimerase n=1 Tax=Aerophobetes bacterium TaxID=2030807 RepID=A0A7V0QRI9_UNCAE|nr:sugar phosphate isomerase/epimerase [Candidatus Aerophobetes bacterium]
MKYGAHSLMWTARFTEKDLGLFDRLKQMGFDGLEIYVSADSIDSLPREKIKEKMRETGMECTISTGLGENQNVISPDENKRKNGVAYLKKAIDLAVELGTDIVSGVLYAAWGKFTGKMRTQQEWNYCKESLLQAAEYAKEKNVILGLEPINRYETYFLNTAEDARKLVEEINHPNIRIHLDTYHLNIEEESFYKAIKTAGEYLCHFHVCENNRGIPGTGHVPWDDVYKALKEINYNRWAIIESFVPAIEEIARMTAIWRKLAPSADVLAEEGLKFLKGKEASV